MLAQCQNIEVAVRSGGHSPNVGFSNTNGGITLDLRGLDSVDLSADGNTAMVGTGNQWGPVYEKLEAQGKTVVGARVYDVGIGGFLSGGKFVPCHWDFVSLEIKLILTLQNRWNLLLLPP